MKCLNITVANNEVRIRWKKTILRNALGINLDGLQKNSVNPCETSWFCDKRLEAEM